MAYRFKFETVLDYRRNLEDLAQQKLVKEQNILANHERWLADLQAGKQRMVADFEERKKKNIPAPLFAYYMDALANKDREIAAQKNTIAAQKRVIESIRAELAERIKDRKVMEKAKERDFTRYWQEYLKREQMEHDEMAVLRYENNRQTG